MDETTDVASSPRRVGPYRLTRSLGKGGFGEVFLGEAEDGTRAAVKILHASWARDTDMRRRFAAEVEQARRVSGFCIAEILDAEPEADEPWIATEYIDGPTLQRAVAEDGPRTGTELQRLAVSTATALAAIHAAEVVHRDLKPDNIMLAQDGPRVIDFGIARAVESTSVTASGIVGTVGYMAPEQLEGMRLTAAVDVFAWASVMVFAATGREAFHGPTQASRIARVLSGEPDTGDLSGPLLEAVLACLDKDPKRRPDAASLLHQLVAGTAAKPVGTADPEPGPPVAPTRVAGAPVPLTRQYTKAAPNPAPRRPAPEPAPPPTPPRTQSSYVAPLSRAARASGGEAPPYSFVGVRFTRIEGLAAAMQQHWSAAVMVLGDPAERAMLGSWVMNDINDTKVDRSLFRREVQDANLAVASFIAQACPELPPRFRGHELTVKRLRELFHDPRPLITGGHEANELMLLARPQLLRLMAQHRSDDAPRLAQLAQEIEEAEGAGAAFHRELAHHLNGWRGFECRVEPALVLAFLLNPELVVPPDSGGLPGVAEWTGALWPRVDLSSGSQKMGSAAAVYASLPNIVTLVQQRDAWKRRHEALHNEHNALVATAKAEGENTSLRTWLGSGAIFCFVASIPAAAAASGSGLGMMLFLTSCALGAAWLAVSLQETNRYGNARVRHARNHRMRNLPDQGWNLIQVIRRMDTDMQSARQICSRPPQ
ncbi:serine/threonine protein kinase [Nocardiopsis metallicus]|uniref:non-specific serine/threonine protein kinase n=1 Tax=Nocardiopsis metallicus TaxID=179819 RepID=A0A840W572_9ACTN|nr:serine/threonine-protein kinase [Nocardiopsis metallicus]MBB5491144.1 serine/threonine protein kinase [Nocardiopsis metallicus]